MPKFISKTIEVDNLEIEFVRKKMKSIRISVFPPNGRVRLAVPFHVSEATALSFLKSKLDWIIKHREKYTNRAQQFEAEYISGEPFYVKGNAYIICVKDTKGKAYVKLETNGILDLYVKEGSTVDDRKKVLGEFLRDQIKKDIPPLLEKWQGRMGVYANEWGVKAMKTRWGTCNMKAKRIWLNLYLAQKEELFLEYVVIHELAHLIEPSHGDRFKAVMDRYCPNWRNIRKSMKNFSI